MFIRAFLCTAALFAAMFSGCESAQTALAEPPTLVQPDGWPVKPAQSEPRALVPIQALSQAEPGVPPARGGADFAQREREAPPAIRQRLAALRADIAARNLSFEVGYTTAMDIPLEMLAGTRLPPDLRRIAAVQNQRAAQMLAVDRAALERFNAARPGVLPELKLKQGCVTTLKSFDWRHFKKVTPVRNQGACGSCWAFAALGAYEGNYAIRNTSLINASEQDLLSCSGAGSCKGGWWGPSFDYLISTGVAREADYPYTASDSTCQDPGSRPYRAVAWGFVGGGNPTIAQMKAALCEYGPLAVGVRATPAFQAYTGGVFDETDPLAINHGVTLIGWDDGKGDHGAWLIKNSWGPWWGSTCDYGTERGYMWIAYGSNRIGEAASWVQAKNVFYQLPPGWQEKFRVEQRPPLEAQRRPIITPTPREAPPRVVPPRVVTPRVVTPREEPPRLVPRRVVPPREEPPREEPPREEPPPEPRRVPLPLRGFRR